MANFISEDQIEQATLQKLQRDYGFQLLNCFTPNPEDLKDGSGRCSKQEVIFRDRLRAAARRLNPTLPEAAIDQAVNSLTQPRTAMSVVKANYQIDSLIRNGIPVEYENSQGRREPGRVRVIDFNDASPGGANEFLAVSQLWIQGQRRFRRPDILLYINGLPLVFIELKNSNLKVKNAFDDNLNHYKRDIPQLFHPNAVCILSNALETKVGSFTATWDYFFNWLRVEDEKEKIDREQIKQSGTSLERAVDGLCAPAKLLDYLENFILFSKQEFKVIAQNHQFIGVNRAIASVQQRQSKAGKLGVFWHTQGSGKSFSMIFYVRKIQRKLTGNFCFVVVTDREDLDGQIYRNFLDTETVTQKEVAQPRNSDEMRDYLGQGKRIVFTLIQKFRWPKGKTYPILSDSSDLIVIVDEAHRTQYQALAENMRAGLPRASYLAFTGTPLLGRDRKTNQWFGDYVSEYSFSQSMDDGATVPLFYQKRVPEVLIQNQDLGDEFYDMLEEENLDEAQQAKLERQFAREVEVIKRDDRLERIAEDIVYHFPRRGYLGKGLVVAVDKFTAVKMYDKVQRLWKGEIRNLQKRINQSNNDIEKAALKKILAFMRETDMAVVISFENSEAEEQRFAKQGLNIKPHRDRWYGVDHQGHDIEYRFKDPENPLRLVFVCAMWLTGFDVPSLSTVYLDKPMKDHTLMQAITRANRVCSYVINNVTKHHGEIIDYYNVFRDMGRALSSYALGNGETTNPPDQAMPVEQKENLFDLLDGAIAEGLTFCRSHGLDLESLAQEKDTFKNLAQFKDYADTLLSCDQWHKEYRVYQNTISGLYEACKPEILSAPRPLVAIFEYLRGVIDGYTGDADTESLSLKVAELLDESITSAEKSPRAADYGVEYKILPQGKTWDLSQTNFEKLKTDFKQSQHRHIEIANLRSFLAKKIEQMLEQNVSRTDFAQRFQEIIDQYNAGTSATENSYAALVDFAESLRQEEERHIRENLTPAELELFDLLKKDKMTTAETQQVKLAARLLLDRLQAQYPKVLVQDWHRDDQSQRRVRAVVETVLDQNLPTTYSRQLFTEKCDRILNLMLDRAG